MNKTFFQTRITHALGNPRDKEKPLAFTLASVMNGKVLKSLEDHMHMAFCRDCTKRERCKMKPHVNSAGQVGLCKSMEVTL
jgi:hypothetical protein